MSWLSEKPLKSENLKIRLHSMMSLCTHDFGYERPSLNNSVAVVLLPRFRSDDKNGKKPFKKSQ